MKPITRLTLPACLITLLLFQGCATTYIAPTGNTNPPPKEPFAAFQYFEVEPIVMNEPYAGQNANERALLKIQENLDLRLSPVIDSWNAAGDPNGRGLLIQPEIEDIKFISGGSRFWAGSLAGSSAVVIRVKFIDKESGEEIAHPEFYQRAAAMGGAYSMGGTDNNMLIRIASLVADYTTNNYEEAVGGPTGGK